MAENSKIEWTKHTGNLWWGCQEVHEGCDNCYARTLDNRYHNDNPHWGVGSVRKAVAGIWKDLLRFQKQAKAENEIHSVFIGSMMDIFEKPMPLVDNKNVLIEGQNTGLLRDMLFQQIDQGLYSNLLLLFLTKRPGNINKYIPEHWQEFGAPKNVMFGTSVVNQETADKMIPELLKVNGRRFLSMEPLLGKTNIGKDYPGMTQMLEGIHWVIVGGESGSNAREMDANWADDIRKDCKAAGVPFFMKQGSQNNWGNFKDIGCFPVELQVREFPAPPYLIVNLSWLKKGEMEFKQQFMEDAAKLNPFNTTE